jgi:hypothetical protein
MVYNVVQMFEHVELQQKGPKFISLGINVHK